MAPGRQDRHRRDQFLQSDSHRHRHQLAEVRTTPSRSGDDAGEAAQQLFCGRGGHDHRHVRILTDAREALGENLGMVKIPDYSTEAPLKSGGIGGAGTALIVSNYSEVKDQAVNFIKHLMSKEEQELRSGEGTLLNVTDVDTSQYYTDPFKQIQQEWANEPSTVFWLDNLYPSELTNEIKAQSQLAWTGQISAEEFLAKADAKRDELAELIGGGAQSEPGEPGALEPCRAAGAAARRSGGLTLQRREA